MKKNNQQNNFSNRSTKDQASNSCKYDNVEPLPESTRPRKDGPGGDGESK